MASTFTRNKWQMTVSASGLMQIRHEMWENSKGLGSQARIYGEGLTNSSNLASVHVNQKRS